MNQARTTFPGLPPPPDPPLDRCARLLPPANAELLILVQILLVYARHLLGVLRQTGGRGFALLAHCCGSMQTLLVLTHLTRGLLRAIALERVLLARAAGEPDPDRRPRQRIACAAQPSGPRTPCASHRQFPGLPTLRQLEAAIRHRPVEVAIDDIRHDLGVCFCLCEARFGNALRDMAATYRDTLSTVFHAVPRRETAIAGVPERDSAFALPPQKPDAIRYIVGCLGAQQPVCGFPVIASSLGAARSGAQPP